MFCLRIKKQNKAENHQNRDSKLDDFSMVLNAIYTNLCRREQLDKCHLACFTLLPHCSVHDKEQGKVLVIKCARA